MLIASDKDCTSIIHDKSYYGKLIESSRKRNVSHIVELIDDDKKEVQRMESELEVFRTGIPVHQALWGRRSHGNLKLIYDLPNCSNVRRLIHFP